MDDGLGRKEWFSITSCPDSADRTNRRSDVKHLIGNANRRRLINFEMQFFCYMSGGYWAGTVRADGGDVDGGDVARSGIGTSNRRIEEGPMHCHVSTSEKSSFGTLLTRPSKGLIYIRPLVSKASLFTVLFLALRPCRVIFQLQVAVSVLL